MPFVAVADFEGICSSDILVFETKGDDLLPELLPYLVQSEGFFEHAIGTSSGSLSPRTKWQHLEGYKFDLPPEGDQRRIVKILTTIDSSIDADRDLLADLDEYRAALAHHHATAHGAKLGPTGVVLKESLPRGWRLLSIRELCGTESNALTPGPFGSDLVVADYCELQEGVPVVFVVDVCRHEFRYTSNRFVSEKKHQALKAHEARPGDVLVTKMGWPPGEACVVPEGWPTSIINADIIRARVDPSMMTPDYMVEVLNSHWGRLQVARLSPGTTRPKITLREFEKIPIATPSSKEQGSILRQFEAITDARGKLTDRLAEAIKLRSLKLAMLLRCPHA